MSFLFSISGDDNYINLAIPFAIPFCAYLFLIKGIHIAPLRVLNRKLLWFSVIVSLFAQSFFGRKFYDWIYYRIQTACANYGFETLTEPLRRATTVLVTLFSFPAVCFFFYIAYRELLRFAKTLNEGFGKTEKRIFVSFSLFFSVLIIIVYSLTCVFFAAYFRNGLLYDIVYSSDSTALYYTNAFLNVGDAENDLRQPLFGVFSAPFSIIPYAISLILSAIPLFSFIPNLYAYLLAIEQAMLLLLSFLLIVDLLDLRGAEKVLSCAIFAFSFPSLLFSLNLEQYIFAVFWLVLYIYATHKRLRGSDHLWLCATGSLLTSALLLPLSYRRERTLTENALNFTKIILLFVALCFAFGRGAYLVGVIDQIRKMFTWAGGGIPLIQRLYQYSAFISSCLVYPDTHIINETIQQVPPLGFDFAGIALFVLAVIGFVINRKQPFAQISFAWLCFSFIMLVVIGWGSKENGMVLYSLYFAWALISLIVGSITAIPKRWSPVRIALLSLALIPLLYFNARGFMAIMDFAITYYPMV